MVNIIIVKEYYLLTLYVILKYENRQNPANHYSSSGYRLMVFMEIIFLLCIYMYSPQHSTCMSYLNSII